jgi:hypothetical protein
MASKSTASKSAASTKANSRSVAFVEPRKVTDPANYIPPPRLLETIIKRGRDANGNSRVEMPAEAFTKLLEAAFNAVFDERAYLEHHRDIKVGVASGFISSGLRHFATHGYFENREPFNCEVDPEWYLKTYPDVARAIKSGQVRDAAHHFELFGYAEGRVPSERFQASVGEWQNIAKPPPNNPSNLQKRGSKGKP